MIPSDHKAFLLAHSADDTAHSGATLWGHLHGVHRILHAIGAPAYLCAAGLFHSVYGTQSFKRVTVDKSRRSEVQALIGDKAESLVFTFCELPRPRLFEAALAHTPTHGASRGGLPTWIAALDTPYDKPQFFADLLSLECANLLEQRALHTFPNLSRHAQTLAMVDAEGFSV